MKKSIKLATIFSILIFLSLFIVSANLPVSVTPQPDGHYTKSTLYDYVFNISQGYSCSNVLVSSSQSTTTDEAGRSVLDITLDALTSVPDQLCEYRDGSLRKAHNFSDAIFDKLFTKQIYTNAINSSDWSNVSITESQISDLGSYMTWNQATNGTLVTLNQLLGFNYYNSTTLPEDNITGYGTTGYIPYWDNNSSLGNSLLYHDEAGQMIGVNTTTPTWLFNIFSGNAGGSAPNSFYKLVIQSGTSAYGGINIPSTASGGWLVYGSHGLIGGFIQNFATGILSIYANNTEVIKVDSSLVNITEDVTIGGQLGITGASRVRAYLGTDQTISDQTETAINFDTENYDNLGEFDTSTNRFKAKLAGYYLIHAKVRTASVAWAAGDRAYLQLRVSATSANLANAYDEVDAAVTKYIELQLTDIVYLDVDDTVAVRLWHDRGSDTDVINNGQRTFIVIHRLS